MQSESIEQFFNKTLKKIIFLLVIILKEFGFDTSVVAIAGGVAGGIAGALASEKGEE